ncbi:MAG: hypothetical protein A2086_01265 [Spirochaetes bacterium GWD1_27_9]|nr:MAG: hypothetical protein A2Z98_13045 [Spirochaetes bacterium GWB1_27_13]OHD44348.1 MAG: hypothetical protein A2086_01265 [Spirochaetes bacterium GWD1_27_9]
MKLKILETEFSILKVKEIPDWIYQASFFSITKTFDEISLIVPSESIPQNKIRDFEINNGWKCIKIDEILNFSLVGILSPILEILKTNNISVFVFSTYNTDYIMVKTEHFSLAVKVLENKKYDII